MLGALGVALGARPEAGGILPLLVSLLLGSAAFVALALLLAGTLRAEAVLAVANLVWVLLLGLGVLVPTDQLPGALATVAALLPSGALGDAVRRPSSTAAGPGRSGRCSSAGAWSAALLGPALLPLGRLTGRSRRTSAGRRSLVSVTSTSTTSPARAGRRRATAPAGCPSS